MERANARDPGYGDAMQAASKAEPPNFEEEQRLWASFAEAASTADFCQAWLALQCRRLPSTSAAVLLVADRERSYAPAAVWPHRQTEVGHLRRAAEQALTQRQPVVLRGAEPPDGKTSRTHVAWPIEVGGKVHGAVVLDVVIGSGTDLDNVLRQLHWGSGWLHAMLWRLRSEEGTAKVTRAAAALDVLAVVEEQADFNAAAMALANELAARLGCDRVSVGMLKRNRVRLTAMSHSAWFKRRTELGEAIESAMEEAVDQNTAVSSPATPSTEGRLAVAHRDLATKNQSAVVSVLMRSRGRIVGVLAFERDAKNSFDAETVTYCETVALLVAPILDLKARAKRWVSGRIVDGIALGLRQLFGPKRPGLKLAAAASLIALVFLALAEGEFRITARSVLEGSIQRAAVAPFEGFVAQAPIRAGDKVREGQVMATLDDKDLLLERQKWWSEREKSLQKYREAQAKHDRPGMGMLAAQVKQAEAQLALTDEKLTRTKIVAPIDGLVISGDLTQMLGSPVEQGKVLYEIAPLDAYRIMLQVDERDIRHVDLEQKGKLRLTGMVATTFPFTVRKITPVSTPAEGRNYFRVEASLDSTSVALQPGMEGIGKIEIGSRPLLWNWSRGLVDWARITLWLWLP